MGDSFLSLSFPHPAEYLIREEEFPYVLDIAVKVRPRQCQETISSSEFKVYVCLFNFGVGVSIYLYAKEAGLSEGSYNAPPEGFRYLVGMALVLLPNSFV